MSKDEDPQAEQVTPQSKGGAYNWMNLVTACGSCNARNADRFAANVRPVIERIQASGTTSLRGIAKELTARNVATARGGQWTPVQVTAILRRAL